MANIGRNANNVLSETIQKLKKKVIALLERGRLEEALTIIKQYISNFDTQFEAETLNNIRALRKAKKDKRQGTITYEIYNAALNKMSFNIQDLLDEIVKEIGAVNPQKTIVTPELSSSVEEKIIGKNDLIDIAWLQKALNASQSVCRVITPTGKGSGFLIKGGLLMTNNHVIRSAGRAANTRIEFNYLEADLPKTTIYRLDNTVFFTNTALDVTIVKIKDKPDEPLSNWGYLKLALDYIPQVDEQVNIIQHPKGGVMKISLGTNEVLSVWDKQLFYNTDTEAGSSGSPVFNENWEVVALHNGGRLIEDGGLTINGEGKKASANRGVLMKYIVPHIPSIMEDETGEQESESNEKTSVEHVETKSESIEQIKEVENKDTMDWKQLNDWIDEGTLSELFKELDEIYDQMKSRKALYNRFKREYESGQSNFDFNDRLKTFLGSLKNQIT